MSPELRRALHRALNIVLDALEDEAKVEKPKKSRMIRTPDLPAVSPDALARAEERLAKKGYRRAS